MPARKKTKPPPNFSFVTLDFGANDVKWLKVHSGSVRSHAAYWGGAAKCRRQDDSDHIAGQDTIKPSCLGGTGSGTSRASESFSGTSAIRMPRQRKSTKLRKGAKSTTLPSGVISQPSPRQISYDSLQSLPSVPLEIKAIADSSFSSGLPIFEFCGEGVVKHFVVRDHDDYSVLFSALLLLSYAHYVALTGQGSKTVVLELKGQVIRRVGAKMKASNGLLSPRCLTAVLALGTAIVCLVSQDLPMSLSIWEYINASMKEDYICCLPESASKAQIALEERIFHRQALHKLLRGSRTSFKDSDSLALLEYVSNWMDMLVALQLFSLQASF